MISVVRSFVASLERTNGKVQTAFVGLSRHADQIEQPMKWNGLRMELGLAAAVGSKKFLAFSLHVDRPW